MVDGGRTLSGFKEERNRGNKNKERVKKRWIIIKRVGSALFSIISEETESILRN